MTSDATYAQQGQVGTSAGAAQTQSNTFVSNKTEDSDQASGKLGDQLENDVQVDELLRYSATMRTIVVDGVEYQVQTNDDAEKRDGGKQEKSGLFTRAANPADALSSRARAALFIEAP